ncbi:LCP family protein [Streptomyces sp. NPDC051907]|uniref:LCP family protein n=1 Tax=Streptomyces sp. NPDC051907 TaxID=3155284 RepID=UPI00341587CC
MHRFTFAVTAALVVSLAAGGAIAAGTSSWPLSDAEGTDGTNILLVGIDSRAGISRAERDRLHVNGQACDCTDVMLLAHLSEDERRLSVVSIPRDSYVEFADHAHPSHWGKINSAFKHGGGDLAVRTVEKATGLRVDHYLEADFTGFVSTVDRLGGADVCTDKPLLDVNSGLKLAAGTHLLNGDKSLRYVRARKVSPPGDLGRVRRQQRLLVGMMARLSAQGAFAKPAASVLTARKLLASVRTDADTTLVDLMSLGTRLGRLKAHQTEFATVPLSEFDHRVPEWGSTLLWHKERSAALWAALKEDRSIIDDPLIRPSKDVPVEVDPATVRLRVTDAAVAEGLRASGFVATDASGGKDAVRPKGPTVVTYDPYWERSASAVAAALPDARLKAVAGHGSVFDVAVGTQGGRVARVVYDRSSVEGAPVPGEQLLCAPKPLLE